MLFTAHIRQDASGRCVQSAAEHCRNAAAHAGACLRSVGLEEAGALVGLLHD